MEVNIAEPRVQIKEENPEDSTLAKSTKTVDLEKFVQDANLLDPDLLVATIGPLIYAKTSLWDVLVQKLNSVEAKNANKMIDCLQLIMSELRTLVGEIQGLLSSCVKSSSALAVIIQYFEQFSQCLMNDLYLEPKDSSDIPSFYWGMFCDVKMEGAGPNLEPTNDLNDDDLSDLEDEDYSPEYEIRKRKASNKNQALKSGTGNSSSQDSDASGSPKKKTKRPSFKDMPPDLKCPKDVEETICDSRKRRYCQVCTKGFGNQKRLDQHMTNGECPGKPNPKWHYTNMTAKRLFCIHPDCLGPSGVFDINYLENSFNSGCIARGYFEHVMDKHATPENCIFDCDSCPKKFPNTYILKYHKDYCGDNFTCRYCGRGVTSKRGLVQHESTHNLGAFKCPHCDHATNRKSLLEIHIRTVHLNLRPEICQLCGKAFKTKKQIAAHILTHSDVKLYSCEICGAKLKNVTCYRSHMMNVHNQRVACDICGKTMFKEEGIRRHKRQEHGIDTFETLSSATTNSFSPSSGIQSQSNRGPLNLFQASKNSASS